LKISNKYASTSSEKNEQVAVSEYAEAEKAFSNQCCALIICAYYKIIGDKKLLRKWGEETITRHLKKRIKLCIKEAELQYFVVPEYPEDDDEIDEGIKDTKQEVYFDLVFSSFNKSDQLYFAVEAKVVIENNYLKRIATTELAEYISNKGMRKFIEGIYKKKGCMIGYVMEGSPTVIVKNINEKIKIDSFYKDKPELKEKIIEAKFNLHYESDHSGYTENPLKHLFLDFTACQEQ
jgi:hypothetical protein